MNQKAVQTTVERLFGQIDEVERNLNSSVHPVVRYYRAEASSITIRKSYRPDPKTGERKEHYFASANIKINVYAEAVVESKGIIE